MYFTNTVIIVSDIALRVYKQRQDKKHMDPI